MKYFIFRNNIAVQNVTLSSEGFVYSFCVNMQSGGNIFYAEYGKFQLIGSFNFLSVHIDTSGLYIIQYHDSSGEMSCV